MSSSAAQPVAQSEATRLSIEPASQPSTDNLTAQNAASALNPPSESTTPPIPSHPFSSRVRGLGTPLLRIKSIISDIPWRGNIGTIATVLSLIAAMVYGPPAWKLAQAQVTLAIQGMKLSQWANCADHAEIQNTTTCRNILDTDFDAIGRRSLHVIRAGLSEVNLVVIIVPVFTLGTIVAWTLSNGLPKLSGSDRGTWIDVDRARTAVCDEIDRHGFDWHIFLVSASGLFTASYAFSAINIMLPTLRFIYWPDTTNSIPELTINCVTLAGSLLGQLLFGFLADKYGRRKFFGFEMLLVIISTLGIAQASSGVDDSMNILGWIIFWRFLMGLGVGAGRPLSAVTTAEYADVNARAPMMAAIFLMQPLGQLTATIVGWTILARLGRKRGLDVLSGDRALLNPEDLQNLISTLDLVWRWVVSIGAGPAVVAIMYRLPIPESPRYTIDVSHDHKRAHLDIRRYYGLATDEGAMERVTGRLNGIAVRQVSTAKARVAKPPSDYFKYDELKEYFWVQRNGLYLVSTSMCWFILDFAFQGLGLNSPRLLTAIWDSTNLNSTFSDWEYLNATIAGEWQYTFDPSHNTYKNLFKTAEHNFTLSFGSMLGSMFLLMFIDNLRRNRWLIVSFLALAVLFTVGAAIGSSVEFRPGQPLTTALFLICQFLFNAGPSCLIFIISAEIFPTKYRCTCHGISASMGTLGSMLMQTAFQGRSFTSDQANLTKSLSAFAALMVLGAFFAWAWLPDVQDKPRGASQATKFPKWPSKKLEELARGRAYAVGDTALGPTTH